jgi:predicted tellurium resistance membrane protein TerC
MSILELIASPAAWAALVTLIVMEVVLGIDNLIFISILSNKLPEAVRARARRIGISLALVMRLGLLTGITWIMSLKNTVFSLGLRGAIDEHGVPAFETDFTWKDLILLAGGLFLVWKATTEIHHSVDVDDGAGTGADVKKAVGLTFTGAIIQILLLAMLIAADPLANFINRNPSVVMLALGFLLMIGMVLIGESFGAHIPKGYIYTAMGFSAAVEMLNIWSRRAKERKAGS